MTGGWKRLKDLDHVEAVKLCFTVGEDYVSIIKQTKYLGLMVHQYLTEKNKFLSLRKKFLVAPESISLFIQYKACTCTIQKSC